MPDPTTEPSTRTVAVTGATGFVGRHLVRELLSRGHQVRALARSAEKAKQVLPTHDRLTIIQGEALDGESLDKLVHGADAAINLIGIIREASGGQTFERLHVDTTRALLRACEEFGVTRYIQMSALGVSDTARTQYAKTKFRAEAAVRASGLEWTIFRPSLVHGADGEFVGMIRDWCKGKAAPWFFLPYFMRIELDQNNLPRPVSPTIAPVHVDDVVRAFADALDQPESIAEVYMLSGPERLTWPELLKTFRDSIPLANTSLRTVGLPGELGAIKAHAMSALGMGNLLPFDAGMAIMGQQDSFASNTKVERHLGFDPRPFTPTVREYAAKL